MKQIRFIAFILLSLPLGLWAQNERAVNLELFYADMAERDAKYELSHTFGNTEDERDFWKDQKAFESALEKSNPTAYYLYLKNKGIYYRNHQITLDFDSVQNEIFATQISFYLSHAPSQDYKAAIALVPKKKFK